MDADDSGFDAKLLQLMGPLGPWVIISAHLRLSAFICGYFFPNFREVLPNGGTLLGFPHRGDWNSVRTRYSPAFMPRIPEETVEQILAATDIVDLINSYIPLKRAGSVFKALCPFHNEKTPSFTVNPGSQRFKCFGCGEGGNAAGFVMSLENLPFPDAVRKLAQRAGIVIQEEAFDPQAERARRARGRLLELHQESARFMNELLLKDPAAQHARDYVKSRGYGAEMVERWLIGWIPENARVFLDWAREAGFTGRELKDSGLANLREERNPRSGLYLRFRDRLMFPIRSDYGDIIAFSGRQLREDPRSGKYVNSPETALFKKSKVFFALDRARRAMSREHFGIICEGQLDAIACHEAGIENTVAPLGTAFTPEHARLLKRYTDDIILCFDSDAAGHKAADRAFRELAAVGLTVRVVTLPDGQDPDSIIKGEGPDAFRALLDGATEFFDYFLRHRSASVDLSQPSEVGRALGDLAPLVACLGEKGVKEASLNFIAQRLGVGQGAVREAVVAAERKPVRNYQPGSKAKTPAVPPTRLDPSIAFLCQFSLQSHQVLDWLCEQTESLLDAIEGLPGEQLLRLILSKRPDSGNTHAVNAFLTTLPSHDQAPLLAILEHPLPKDPLGEAAETLARLSLTKLERQIEEIHSKLRNTHLSPEELVALQNEATKLQSFIQSTRNS
jgi:DNA primase